MTHLPLAKKVLDLEAGAIRSLIPRLTDDFNRAVDTMSACRGKVVVMGMGKGGLIGRKISATLSSTGTPSIFLHAAEAIHGDLGQLSSDDVVLVISNSGETEEVKKALPLIKKLGAKLIAMTGKLNSSLARYADFILDVGVKKEACPLNLAPTSSTTATLAMGDALAVCLIQKKGFKEKDFAFYHPGGALGRRLLLRVEDLMRSATENVVVKEDEIVKSVLLKITRAHAGAASVVNKNKKLTGIFTDGDLRRHLEKGPRFLEDKVKNVMTKSPIAISKNKLAAEALGLLKNKHVDEIPVLDERGYPVGMLDVQDLLKAGFA